MISRIGNTALNITVFAAGALVMIYEIVGSRVVAPYIGTSTYIWTSLIGVILGSLSLGYWLGGRVADRRPSVGVLASSLFASAGLVAVTILIKDVALAVIGSAPVALEIKSIGAAVILFAPASVALGFVAPYAARLRIASVENSGQTVGRLYALSTVGSIFGTFAAGYFFLPFVGSTRTLYIIAASLFALSLLLAPFAFTRLGFFLLTLFGFAIIGSELQIYYLRTTAKVRDFDTEYSRIRIFDTTDPSTNRPIRALATDPFFVQSAIYLDADDPALKYGRYYNLLKFFRPEFSKTLMIGGAGFTYPREYLSRYPQAFIDVVEIDQQMESLARTYFRLADNPRLRVYNEDGRMFLNRSESGKYDAVLMDAFGSLFSVPFQLTTQEAVRQIYRNLNDRGIVIFNVGSAIRGQASRFLQAEFVTYRSVFADVKLFKVSPEIADERLQNVIIVACKVACWPAEVTSAIDAESAKLLSTEYTSAFPLEMPVLTDDLAPVEYYGSAALGTYNRR